MNKEKLYTAADFANYHLGIMPVDDMHALEKKALEDPFLYDALDGYAHTKKATTDIKKLKEKLNIENEKISPVKSIANKTLWRVAASIISLLGVGYLFYAVNKNENTSTLAKNTQAKEININSVNANDASVDSTSMLDVTLNKTSKLQQETATEKDFVIKLDTTKNNRSNKGYSNTTKAIQLNDADVASANTKIDANTPTDAKLITHNIEEKIGLKKANEAVITNNNLAKDVADKKYVNNSQNQLTNYYNYSGIVQNRAGRPMQNATVHAKNIIIQTDPNGRFNFKSLDTNINVSIAAVGYAKQDVVLNANTNNIFTLNDDNKNLKEAVVTSDYNTQRRKSVLQSDNTISNRQVPYSLKKQETNNAQPSRVGGIEIENKEKVLDNLRVAKQINIDVERERKIFDNYVTKNRKSKFGDKGNDVKGKVILSFTINKKGQPTHIKIIKSLNSHHNAQAIELLANGPTWIFKNWVKETVEIIF